MFKCFKKQEEYVDTRYIYQTDKDSVYSLKKRIDLEEIEETDFDKEYLKQNEEYLKEHKTDIHFRYILFYKLLTKIDYDKGIRDININIEDLRLELDKKMKNLPTYFTQNSYIINKKKLEKVLLNEIHIDNIKKLIELL
jgi:hypothetical protein